MDTKPLKSILKPSTARLETRSQEDRNRETALYHANLIQHRKNIEMDILTSMEDMIDLPLQRGPHLSAASPSSTDVSYFKSAMRLYQPTDYDDLVQERNINDRCGYVLCPNLRLKESDMKKGQYRIIGKSGNANNFKVVDKDELEKWCSTDCAKRALYVRVQLSERPAWERTNQTASIDLMREEISDKERQEEQLVAELNKLKIVSADGNKNNLALERGDHGHTTKGGMVGIELQEKDVVQPVIAPSFDGTVDTHMKLEGYDPRFGVPGSKTVDEDQDMDTDWDLS